jgi:hypothetical protein
MMYGNKLAAAIKVNGKVLREFKDSVYIPYGAEYTILIKNLNTQKAVVNVYIDGDNVVPNGLVINPDQEVDLERSIVNNNLNEGNRFKFIERTENIENGPRGIKLEDGLIRIEHQFEQPRIFNVAPAIYDTYIYPQGGIMRGAYQATYASTNTTNISATSATMDSFVNDTGITVPGSHSTQKFQTTVVGLLESVKHSMVIKLLGDLGDNKPVVNPVTVKHKVKCVTCGRQNKAHAKFCSECGTSLELVT